MKLPGALLTMAMVALLVSACSFGSDSGGGSDASGGRERTEAEQPLGTDPEAVTPYVSELLLAYDRLMIEINADPSIANDPDDAAPRPDPAQLMAEGLPSGLPYVV